MYQLENSILLGSSISQLTELSIFTLILKNNPLGEEGIQPIFEAIYKQ